MKVYEYGALAPRTNMKLVSDQMHLAHRYYNALIELTHTQKTRVDAVLRRDAVAVLAAEQDDLNARIEAERAALQALRRSSQGSEKSAAKALRESLKPLFTRLSEVRAALSAERKQLKTSTEVQEMLAAVYADISDAKKALRAASGLYWGTYLVVEAAVEAAVKECAKRGQVPEFKRWSGAGHVAVQTQQNLPTAGVFGQDRRVRVTPVDPRAWVRTGGVARGPREGRRPLQRTVLQLRVGTEENGRDPVFTEVPLVLDRPLPPGIVKWVHLLRKPVANSYRWVVQFNVDDSPEAVALSKAASSDLVASGAISAQALTNVQPPPVRRKGIGAAGLDVGWRLMDDGSLRVAVVRDEYGTETELRLPAELLRKNEHTSGLQALRDRTLDEVKMDIIAWLASVPASEQPELPQAAHVAKWRNPRRVRHLLTDHQALMPQALQDRLAAFLKQDLHLWQWQENERMAVLDRRRELYRQFVLQLSTTYSRIGIEKFDLRDVTERGSVENEAQTTKRPAQRQRALACVSKLRELLANACLDRDVELVKLPAEYTTLRCSACGTIDEAWDPATSLRHTCPTCAAEWDQDSNAAQNLLAALLLTPPSAPKARIKKKSARHAQRTKNRRDGQSVEPRLDALAEVLAAE